jgi:hypothetical protein
MADHATEKTEFDRIANEYAAIHARSIVDSGWNVAETVYRIPFPKPLGAQYFVSAVSA